ncbi:hypothetical protein KGM_216022 [Danaus plexippus plexippus]|uniref:Uncharacterized protein n=1 Tax=Danaus plexippus plexippus TaxID=278856 RepID=A0A212EVQ7_DANPL|nr:hypothetical protein KGM_216022 [Danaus plexippus plexippus]
MLNFTNRELALIAVALDAEENERPKRKRKAYWVHEMFKQRKKEGEYWTARRHLLADESIANANASPSSPPVGNMRSTCGKHASCELSPSGPLAARAWATCERGDPELM